MAGETVTWIDGQPASALPLPDRGLEYGDGLFETLLLHRGRPLYLDLHLARLARGFKALGFPDVAETVTDHVQQVQQRAVADGMTWSAVRLSVTRGSAPRGYAAPSSPVPRVLLQLRQLERVCDSALPPAVLHGAEIRLAQQPALAGIKHLNRLEQVLAATEAKSAGADDALLRDSSDALISAGSGNLFLVKNGGILTPDLSQCGIAGTRRQALIDSWAPALGIPVQTTCLYWADLEEADEVFYSNSLQCVRSVSRVGDLSWPAGRVCAALFEHYRRENF